MNEIKLDLYAQERTFLAAERNKMAAERTFTSWIRTGLSGVGGSVAMMHLLTFETPFHQLIAHLAGYLLLTWGAGVFLIALSEYERSVSLLNRTYPQIVIPMGRRRGVVYILFLLVLLLLVLFLT